MESAQTTGAEGVAVRVHSRKSPRALDPQGLYQKALEQEVADPELCGEEKFQPEISEQDPNQDPDRDPDQDPDQDLSKNQNQVKNLEGTEQQVPEQQVIDQQAIVPPAPELQDVATQVVEAEVNELKDDHTVTCETFDASPVDASDEHYDNDQNYARSETAQAIQSSIIGADDRVSKKDLVSLLEGFVRIIKTDDHETTTNSGTASGTSTNSASNTGSVTGTGIELSRPTGVAINQARVDDRTVEIDQLRGLVIEAQDTIIKLLTDRVEDRSRIATLEAQLCLIPDLQAQADRAMSVAVRTDEYRTELTKMKFELDRFRLFRVRTEAEQKKGSVFNRIQKWLFSRPMAKDDNQQRDSYQKMVDGSGTKNSALS